MKKTFTLLSLLFLGTQLFSQNSVASVGPAPNNGNSSARQSAPPQFLNANTRGWCFTGYPTFQFNSQFMGSTALTPVGAPVSFQFPGASAWKHTTNQFIVVDQLNFQLFTLDTNTAALTPLVTCTGVPFGNFTGLAWDHTTNTMYGVATDVSQSQIFTVNLSTGVCTPLGAPTTVVPGAIMLNVSPGGTLFSVDIVNNNLYRWNKVTGVPTLVGPTGVDPNFGQDGYFDFSDGTYYWAAYTVGPELRTIDTLTGASTLIGPYSSVNQVETLTLKNNVCTATSSSQTLAGCNGFTVTVGTNTYNATGVYHDTLVNAGGCDSIVTTNLTIDPFSDAGLVSADTAVCEGSNINMSTTGNTGNISWYLYDGNNYTFINSGTSTTTNTPPSAGTYSVVAVATSGLCPSDTFNFTPVNVYAPSNSGFPYTSISGSDLCAGDSILFMDSLFIGNIDWIVSMDSGATWNNFGSGNNYNPGSPNNNDVGYYMFAVVATNGVCASDTSDTFSIDVRPTPVVFVGNDTTLCGNSLTLDAGNPGDMYLWSNGDTTQTSTVNGSGTYIVTVTTQYGCAGHDTINVNINNNPVVNLGADTASCGNAILLDAQIAGATYLWNDNSTGQTLSASTSGTYYVTVTDNNTCSGSDTINVTINTPPTVTASASASTVCADDANVTLTGSPAGGTWNGPGITGNSFDPSVGAGVQNLIYIYTDTNGCEGSAGVSITVNACVGITENNAGTFNVFPVPFQNAITITTNNSGEYRVRMMNAAGQVVMENEFNGNRTEIQTETLAAGLYWIEIAGANGTQIFKVTK